MEDINEFTTQRKQFNHVVLKVLKAEAELHNERTTDLSFEFLFVNLSLRYLLSCVATWRGLCVCCMSHVTTLLYLMLYAGIIKDNLEPLAVKVRSYRVTSRINTDHTHSCIEGAMLLDSILASQYTYQ